VTGTNCKPSPSPPFPGSATGTTVTLGPCTYTVTEVGATGGMIEVNGHKFVVTQCGPQSIAAGEQKICIILNTEVRG